jgi:Icc-related predicted phosphoesterase
MTNIHLISDIHLEYEYASMSNHRAPEGTDVVILAGDMHPGVWGVMWAAEHFRGLPVLYIPGNHEYYGKRGFRRHVERMREKAAELGGNVRVCDRDEVVIDNTRFLLTTLWTDYDLYGTRLESMMVGQARMNDYKNITQDLAHGCLMTPHTILEHHKDSLLFLDSRLSVHHDGPTVVVTHHAPSRLSFVGDDENLRDDVAPCYASNLDDFILRHQPEFWFHGHLHQSVDYTIGSTRVMSNPRGWVSRQIMRGGVVERENPHWNSQLIIPIPGNKPDLLPK